MFSKKSALLIIMLMGLLVGFSVKTFANFPYSPPRSPYNQDATTPTSGDTVTDPTQNKFQKKDDGCKCSTVNPRSLEMSMPFGKPDTIVSIKRARGPMRVAGSGSGSGGIAMGPEKLKDPWQQQKRFPHDESNNNQNSPISSRSFTARTDSSSGAIYEGGTKLYNGDRYTEYIIPPGKVKLHFDAPTPKMFSPQSIMYDFVFESYLTVNRYKFVLRRPNGYDLEFYYTGLPATSGSQVSYLGNFSSFTPLPEKASSSQIFPPLPGDDSTPWTPASTYSIRYSNQSLGTYEQIGLSPDGNTAYYKLTKLKLGDRDQMRELLPSDWKIGIEVIRDDDKAIRQIKSKTDGLTDVTVVDQYKYQIKFYNNGSFGAKVDGLYTINTGAIPRETWTIENPQRSDTLIDKIKITKSAGGVDHVYNWEYIEASKTWEIEEGNATEARKSSKTETTNPTTNETIVTTTAKNSQDEVKYKEQETYTQIDEDSTPVIKEKIVDPDGAALKTEFIYNESGESKGMLAAKKYSGGSWEKYTYDSGQRPTVIRLPRKMARYSSTDDNEMQIAEYSYAPLDAQDTVATNDNRPRIIRERVNGVYVSVSYMVDKTVGTERVVIKEQGATPTAMYGATGNLRTTTVYDTTTGNIKSVTYPDGKKDTYTYEKGNYTPGAQVPGSFTVDANGACTREIIMHGTTVSQEGIAYKTTKEIIIYDEVNDIVLKELYAYTGSTYEKISWEVYVYDSEHHITNTYKSNNTQTSATWNCCNKESETLADGSEYTYTYDSLERVKTKTKKGISGSTPDIVTTYTYDSESRVTSVSVYDGTNTLTNSTTYDTAGRVTSKTDTSGLTTTYAYTSATSTTGDIITVTYPDGSTKITEKYFDGNVKSITGTAVVATYYDYGAESSTGYQWARRSVGSFTSGRYTKTYRNALGKVAKIEKSGYNGSIITTQFYYNNYGQLYKKTQTGLADILYEYDSYGCVSRQGLDVNGNGTLDLASSDRIVESDTVFSLESSDWWLTTTKKIYATADSSATTTTSVSKTRLTGLASGVVSETKSTDIHGNETTATTSVNRTTKTIIQTVNVPSSSIDAQTVAVNGLVTSKRSSSNLTYTFAYDGLGRRTGVIDPRIGQATVAYYTSGTGKKGKIYTQTDAAGNTTTYDYTSSGRLAWVKNALNKYTYYDYNTRGQVTRTWGDTGYPIEKGYDSYGQMTMLKTYRAGTGWTGSTWPTATTGTADTTAWAYDVTSGLVTSKTFADSKSVSYTYTFDGKLYTRTWARTSGGNPLTTTYSYDSNTGEQTGIDYSDSTQDITFSYTRTGQKYQVTDSVGTRTFAYNAALQPTTETIVGGLYSKTLTNNYATTGVVGRYTGMNISTEYSKTLGYDTYGRPNTLTSGSDTYTYNFLTNSSLVTSITRPNNLTTDYTYETNRNMITAITNKYNGSTTISSYGYVSDAIGRRTSKSRTGTAFATSDSITFGYNDRSEVTSAVSNNITAYNYGFAFDNIGNRSSYTVAGTGTTYTADNLNQYTAITKGTTINPTYDDDGCMLTWPQIAGGTWNNTWNGENRLIETYNDTAGKKLEFVYDYMGRRVEKKVYTGTSGTSWTLSAHERFVYDGYKCIEVLDGTNSNAILQKFLWGGDTPLSVYDVAATTTYYYFADANKNIGQLMDSSGNIVAKYEYSPFGVQTFSTGTYAASNPFRFSSEYYDSETGLVYYNYRYYSPELGRWLSRDPIGEAGGSNLYAMVSNSPINSWDSLGLCDCGYDDDESIDDFLDYWFADELYDELIFDDEEFWTKQPEWFAGIVREPLGKESEKIKKEIEDTQDVIDSLYKMYANWKEGETYKDYGLRTEASDSGYRSDSFYKRSKAYQKIVNDIENNTGFNWGCKVIHVVIGGANYWSFGLHGAIHNTTTSEQLMLTHLQIEIARKKLVKARLQKKYNEIK